jgi:uncharacterized protein YndB with AHSA1/START domain
MSTATLGHRRQAQQQQTGYELSITRIFDAPRDLVWKAWTDPAMAANWMGPRGFQTTEFVTSPEPGGRWRLCMEGHIPGTGQMAYLRQGGAILEIDPPKLLVYTFAWDDRSSVGLPPSRYQENVVTIRLEELGSKTIMHFSQTPFATEGERDGHAGGWNSAFDRLAEFVLAEQPPRSTDPTEVPTELHLKRFFAAPRDLVFAAWTNPEILAQWWGPKGFTNPICEFDPRAGGAIRIHMRAPDGAVFPMSGRIVEFYPPYRFHFTSAALDNDGVPLFELWNSVFFAEVEGGTEIVLDVHVLTSTPAAPQFLKGMPTGWSQSLDRLSNLLTPA